MSIFDAIGDILSNEASHLTNLYKSFGDSPGKTLTQFALGAEDPLGASLWGKVLGTKFTPGVNQFGGETGAQYKQSRSQGVDTGTSQTLGQIADLVAGVWGGSEAGGALGGLASDAGTGAEAGAGAEAGGSSLPADVSVGTTGAGGSTATAGAGEAATGASGSAAAGSSSSWLDYAKAAGKAVAPAVVSSLMQPKPPKTKAPTAMPDPLAQQQAQQQKILQQLARRGRASTILTSPGNSGGSLGG